MRTDIFHRKPDLSPDTLAYPSLFNELNAISGGVAEITPELAMELGYTVGEIAERVAVSYSDHSVCKLLANAFIAGAGSSGVQITETDAGFFAAAAYIARTFLFNLSVFFENDGGRFRVRMIDKYGLPIERELQRKIEFYAHRASFPRVGAADTLMPKSITGVREAFSLSASGKGVLDGFAVSVFGKSAAAEGLRYALDASGARVIPPKHGVVAFSVSDDGEKLCIRDEDERWHDDGHTIALLSLIHFSTGEQELAVPTSAPSALEQIAAEFDGRILRIGRDSGAREIFVSQNVLTDAASSAVFLCAFLLQTGDDVRRLMRQLPSFTLVSREVTVAGNRREILSHLADGISGTHKENTGELRVCADGGWVSISPARSKSALRVTGESINEEIASELCNLYIEKARAVDKTSHK